MREKKLVNVAVWMLDEIVKGLFLTESANSGIESGSIE